MEIKQEMVGNTGRFYIEEGNDILAEMEYEFADKINLLITHIEVSESLEGRGIGRQLVAAVVEYARKNSLLIKATCPFAKKVLDKTPEFADVYNAEKNK